MPDKITPTILGAAGEYHVMSQLLRRGMIAALAPAGAPNVDILVSDPKRHVLTDIQVKTADASSSFSGWQLNSKQEEDERDSLVYCFVKFEAIDAPPTVWIMPSAIVASTIKQASAAYLTFPKRDGSPREPGDRRWIRPRYPHLPELAANWLDTYRNAWRIIIERRENSN